MLTDLKTAVSNLGSATHAEQVAKFQLQRLEDELMDGKIDRAAFSLAYEQWAECAAEKHAAERAVARCHAEVK